MTRHDDDDDAEEERHTRGLVGFIVVLLLALAASYLIDSLRQEGMIEDCLLAGRANCDALIDAR